MEARQQQVLMDVRHDVAGLIAGTRSHWLGYTERCAESLFNDARRQLPKPPPSLHPAVAAFIRDAVLCAAERQ